MIQGKRYAVGLAAVMTAGSAHAQEDAPSVGRFAQAGQFAISAERMFGVTHSEQTQKEGGIEQSSSSTSVSFLSTQFSQLFSVYTTPRIGLDYFVIDGLTLGGALGVFTISSSTKVSGSGVSDSTDGPSLSGVIVSPRLGYAYMFSDVIGIWPRVGFTYVGFGTSGPNAQSDEIGTHASAITLEAPIVISPVEHVGILLSPTLDVGVGGSTDRTDGQTGTTTSTDIKATEFGLQAGLMVYL